MKTRVVFLCLCFLATLALADTLRYPSLNDDDLNVYKEPQDYIATEYVKQTQQYQNDCTDGKCEF
jgi:hypothetical protein